MAPRRNTAAGGSLAEMHNLLINPSSDTSDLCSDLNLSSANDSLATSSAASSPTSMRDVAFLNKMISDMENLFPQQQQQLKSNHDPLSINTNHLGLSKSFVQLQCCIPNETCMNVNSRDFGLINLDDLSDCVRIVCSNESCSQGQYMHRDCFSLWERTIMQRLNVFGPTAAWTKLFSEQTIWTQENYSTIFRMCQCKCGGFLRKDLNWCAPTSPSLLLFSHDEVDNNNNDVAATLKMNKKSKNKNSRKNQKPILNISTGYHQNFPSLGGGSNNNSQLINTSSPLKDGNCFSPCWLKSSPTKEGDDSLLDSRSGSVLSSDLSLSPIHNSSSSSSSTSFNNGSFHVKNGVMVKHQQSVNKSKTELYSERIR